ncbi:Chitinase 4 [Salvia divinorum]|uniref:Chitinase 4 n=1 Tax=Salvia divinorum TaxID=28513 RepID=A0ABD1I3R0_SALDI
MTIFITLISFLLAAVLIAGPLQTRVSGQTLTTPHSRVATATNSPTLSRTRSSARAAFLEAARSYPLFRTTGSPEQEIAAFFAHVTHETGHMCHIEEINGASKAANYCDKQNRQYPCKAGKGYHGRSPVQPS